MIYIVWIVYKLYYEQLERRVERGIETTVQINLILDEEGVGVIENKEEIAGMQIQSITLVRLYSESQNTKLLKLQQEERKANEQYSQKKKNMESILESLSNRAQKFKEE